MSVAAISDVLAQLRKQARVMADYRVVFFNNLLNSYGKPFKCWKRQKKQNANLSDWRMFPTGNAAPNS
jgi:hypothetical protein